MAGTTTNYGWYLSGGGSSGLYPPDEVADIDKINGALIDIDADLKAVSDVADGVKAVNKGGTGATDAATARTNLGLGSIATRVFTTGTGDPSGGSDGDLYGKIVT